MKKIILEQHLEQIMILKPIYEEKLQSIKNKKRTNESFNLTDFFIIYYIEKNKKPVCLKELIEITGYSKRSISYSIKKLLSLGILKKLPNLPDLRRYNYIINKQNW